MGGCLLAGVLPPFHPFPTPPPPFKKRHPSPYPPSLPFTPHPSPLKKPPGIFAGKEDQGTGALVMPTYLTKRERKRLRRQTRSVALACGLYS